MTWNPGFSRLDACGGRGILPGKPDPAEVGTLSGDIRIKHPPAEAGTPLQDVRIDCSKFIRRHDVKHCSHADVRKRGPTGI